ncbi:MAG: hypothetical protein KDK70_22890, partial [Myxococcales bacterium]|nr:hypothetical protein [Myxococcales bacterium]
MRAHVRIRSRRLAVAGLLVAACPDPGEDPDATSSPTFPTTLGPTGPGTGSTGDPTGGSGSGSADSTATSEAESGPSVVFDVGGRTDVPLPLPPSCEVVDDMNAVGDCQQTAPPDSFQPDVQWEWLGDGAEQYVVVTPLVANLTDDDGNGSIDLCDVPDIVVVAWTTLFGPAHIHVLDGETGTVHYTIPETVDFSVAPALGDIDGDGLPEIVVVDSQRILHALEHDLTLKWSSVSQWQAA